MTCPAPCGPPLPLFGLQPPYLEFQRLAGVDGLLASPRPAGMIVAVGVASPSRDGPHVPELVRRLRSTLPAVPVVLRVERVSPEVVRFVANAGRFGIRAAIADGEPMPDSLRLALTQPCDLSADVVEWLALRGVRMSPPVAALVAQIFAHGPYHDSVSALLRLIREPETSARHRFRRKRLPPPHAWHRAARALHAALHLQARPHARLLAVALELGYSDHSALSQQLRRAFGLRPGSIRPTLGWEWLLDRWVAAAIEQGPRRVRD